MGFTSKITGTTAGGLALIIIVVMMLAMSPVIVAQEETATADADDWNFTGAEGAESLVGLIPFIWYAAIVLLVVAGSFLLAKGLGGG